MFRMPLDNTILILKKDLKTENGVFTKGTRVIIKKKYHTMYYDRYDIHSAEKTDFLYISNVNEVRELIENVFETDIQRTKQYQKYLGKKHLNISAILVIALVVFGFVVFGFVCISRYINTVIKSLVASFVYCWICVSIAIFIYDNKKNIAKKNEKKLNELLSDSSCKAEVLSDVLQ